MVSDTFRLRMLTVTILVFAGVALLPAPRALARGPQEGTPPPAPEVVEEPVIRDQEIGEEPALGVEAGLAWLAGAQLRDGSWPAPEGTRSGKHQVGVSGLALLAFLGAGNTHQAGPYKAVVAKGLEWLRNQQDAEGCIGPRASPSFTYDHALAALAITECYGMTRSALLKKSAQAAVNFALQAQNPYKGWRYGVRPGDNDTSVTAWMVMVLKSAKLSGLEVSDQSLNWAHTFIDEMTDPETGRVGYTRRGERPVRAAGRLDDYPSDLSEANTAMGMMVRIFCGESPSESHKLQASTRCVEKHLPYWDEKAGSVDMIYWYFGTLAMFQVGGESWQTWSTFLRKAVQPHQRDDGEHRGSWDPVGPWGEDGGRVYSTALMTLCLEVRQRYRRVFGTGR